MLTYILASLLVLIHGNLIGRYVKEVKPRNNLIEVSGEDLIKTNLEIVKNSEKGDDFSLLDKAIKTSIGNKEHSELRGLFSLWLHKSKNFQFNNDYWDWPFNFSLEENSDYLNPYHQKRGLNTTNVNETDYLYEESKEAIDQSRNKKVYDTRRHSPIKDLYKIIQNHTLCRKEEENLGLKGWFCLYKDIKYKKGNTNILKRSIKLTGVWTAGFYFLIVIPMWIIRLYPRDIYHH